MCKLHQANYLLLENLGLFYPQSSILTANFWVTFYFILTPFPATCKLVIWLPCEEFLLKFCPLRLQPAEHVSRCPRRWHRRPVPLQSEDPQPLQACSKPISASPRQLVNPAERQDTRDQGFQRGAKPGSSFLSSAGQSCSQRFVPCPCKPGLRDKPWLCPALNFCLSYR